MDVRVRFQISGRGKDRSHDGIGVTVPAGSTLSDAIARAGLPLARACGADGLCGRCGVVVLEGGSQLAPETEAELRVKERNRIDPALRLACQTRVAADLEITARYW